MRTHNMISMVALMVTAAGCGALPNDGVEGQRNGLVNTPWSLGSVEYISGWSSGNTTSLSSWKGVDCVSKYGSQYILSALTGFKEPFTNADAFIAKLQATCTEFHGLSDATSTLFTGPNYRATAYELDTMSDSNFSCPTFYDQGPMRSRGMVNEIILGLNPGKDYVQNFGFLGTCARSDTHGGYFWTLVGSRSEMIPDEEYAMYKYTTLECPGDNWVATGFELRYDTRNGKIRDARLTCRELRYN